jgi:hypothetical protein
MSRKLFVLLFVGIVAIAAAGFKSTTMAALCGDAVAFDADCDCDCDCDD